MEDVHQVSVNLDAGQIAFIERQVTAGRFRSLAHFLEEAVRTAITDGLFKEPDEDSPEFEALLAECEETAQRIDAGLEPVRSLDEVMAELKADLATRRDQQRYAAE